jgi:hypothetical protein
MGSKASLDGTRNLAPTGVRSPDRPARSQSLYRLSYRARRIKEKRPLKSVYSRAIIVGPRNGLSLSLTLK